MTYPYPGDSPVAVARRIARAYRSLALTAGVELVADMDRRCEQWGETWVMPRVLRHHLDDWLTPAEAADVAAVKSDTIGTLRRRGRLPGTRTPQGWRYRYRDVLAVTSVTRSRQSLSGGVPDS